MTDKEKRGIYEIRKALLIEQNLTPEEYEKAITIIVEELNI